MRPAGRRHLRVLAAGRGAGPAGRFGWDELHTATSRRAKKFYGDVFGWTVKEMDMGDMGRTCCSSDGDTDRAGAMTQMPGDPSPPHWLDYVLTRRRRRDDREGEGARRHHLHGADGIPNIGRFSIAADPTGAVFGIYQPS